MFMYIHTYMRVTTINVKRNYEFEIEQGEGYMGDFGGR